MFRLAFLVVAAAAATLTIAPMVTVIGLVRSTSPAIDRLNRLWGKMILAAAGVRLSTEGAANVDRSRQYVLVANHASYLDIPVLLVGIPQPLRFFAKRSLFQIPVFGWGLAAAGFIPIDRKNRAKATASFDLAVQRIGKGNSIVVFPEEGRSREPQMRPFQRGAFHLALKSALPVLPVAIAGTWDVLPPGRRWIRPGPVTIRIGAPIETAGMSIRDRERLTTMAREEIEGGLAIPAGASS
ncbi:MAG: lysophospholipid acyltransferase family protein [Thermoanaerobaculia bacterium]